MKNTSSTSYWTTDRIMRLIIGLGITAAVVALIRYLSNVLLPFVVACFVAYLLQPLQRFNQRWTHTKGRTLASILSILEVSAVIALIIWLFLPSVIKEVDMLSGIVKRLAEGRLALPRWSRPLIQFINEHVNQNQIRELLSSSHIETIIRKGSSLLEESIDVIIGALGWALTLVYILFILIDYPKIVNGFKLIFPHKYRDRGLSVVRDVERNMNSYFRGQGVVALCACVFYCIGFSIAGLPLAIPMGLLVGILYMIPYFQYITLIPVVLIAFIYSLGGHVDFTTLMSKCLLVYVVSQSICDYLITPHIMGREMGLNPAVILLSLSVWGALLGIIGMIIALPTTALIFTYYERYISEPAGSRPGKSPQIERKNPSQASDKTSKQ